MLGLGVLKESESGQWYSLFGLKLKDSGAVPGQRDAEGICTQGGGERQVQLQRAGDPPPRRGHTQVKRRTL